MKLLGILVAGFLTAAVALPASANVLNFTITGDYSAQFQMNSHPVVGAPGPGFVAGFYGVPGTFQNASSTSADVFFYHGSNIGGVTLTDPFTSVQLLQAIGAQVYTGSEYFPVFSSGVFNFTGPNSTESYTLTITSSIPEPASWGLMIGGFGLAGAALRQRRVGMTFRPL